MNHVKDQHYAKYDRNEDKYEIVVSYTQDHHGRREGTDFNFFEGLLPAELTFTS